MDNQDFEALKRKVYGVAPMAKSHGMAVEGQGFYIEDLKKGYGMVSESRFYGDLDVDPTKAREILKEHYENNEKDAFKWFLSGMANNIKGEKVKQVLKDAAEKETLDDMIGEVEKLGAGTGVMIHYKWHDKMDYNAQREMLPRNMVHGKKMESGVKVLTEAQKKEDLKRAEENMKRLKDQPID